MPILILGGSHFGTQARRPYLGVLIQNNPILQESPGSVDDLGAGLDGHLLLAAGDTMRHQTNILWKLPFPNALHLDSLFAVHNIVMDDAWWLHAIAFGSICV